MAVGVLMEFASGDNAAYDRVLERMGLTDGGFRVVDVWESAEQFQKFAEEQIAPLSAAEGFPPPEITMWEVHNTMSA